MRDLKREISLKLYLADYNYIPEFMLEMHKDMYRIHRILNILHL